ncbi:MAG: SpoIIE family protein phosphatase [Nocardioides sp.]
MNEPRAAAAREAFMAALVFDDPVQLYERAPCGFLSTTPDGTIVKANGTFRSWVGYDAREIVGVLSFVDLLTPGGRIYHETHYAPSLQMHGHVREIAVDLVCKDGRRLPVLVNATVDHDDSGRPQVIRVAVFDATERRRYERELVRAKEIAEAHEENARALARTLQRSLVPPTPPRIPDLDIATAYHAAGAGDLVGGDFIDVFPIAGGDWAVLIGDVLGKGIEAALVTTFVRHTVRDLVMLHPETSEVLHHLSRALDEHPSDRFCTVALLRLRRVEGGWRVQHATGGHPPPIVVRRGESAITWGAEGCLVGALVEDPWFGEAELVLGPGDLLGLYTDGATEARRDAELYGEGRLMEMFCTAWKGTHDPQAVVDALLDDVLDFQVGVARDDIALVALAVPAAD